MIGNRIFNTLSAALFCVLLVFAQSAQARIIGIVFDNSGSMDQTIHLPAFGAQFIVSTLDGQTDPSSADRLFYARLTPFRVIRGQIDSQTTQQSEILKIRKLFAKPDGGGTPIDMVGRTLKELVAEGRQDEEIFLVVITDGQFGGDFPGFQQNLRNAAQSAKGPVRTEFVLINQGGSDSFTQSIRGQNVFPLLNSTFNGNPDEGFHDVRSFDSMFEAMRKITARISGTEQVGQGSQIKVSGDTMSLDSPFSISRIVAVSTTDNGAAPPSVVSKSFSETHSYSYETKMDKKDSATGWDKIMNGLSQHYTFQPALSPGTHSITFDQRLGPNSFLLFESEAVIDLQVYDRNGVLLQPGSSGFIEVSQGDEYVLHGQVFSQESAGAPVQFTQIDPAASFKSDLISPAGTKQSLAMTRNDSAHRAEGKVTFNALGDHGLQAVLRWPGFVSPTSKIVKIRVVDRKAELSIEVDPFEVDQKGAIPVDVAPPGTPVPKPIAQITVSDSTAIATGATLRLEGAPDWITLQGPSGQALEANDVVALNSAISLIADGSQIVSGDMIRPWPFKIVAEAATPARGTATADVTVEPRLAPAKAQPIGHSKDSTGKTPLNMTGQELLQNRPKRSGGIDALDFEIRDTLQAPALGENVEIIANPPFGVRLRPVLSGNTVSVFPETSWWCPCILYLTGRPTNVAVLYDDGSGLQRVQSDPLVLDVTVTQAEAMWSCLLILGLILLILYLIKAFLNGMATQRFPKQSIAEIDDGGELTRKIRLRGSNMTFFKVLLWPIYGVPHERAAPDGLALMARRGGAYLVLTESNLQFESDTYDDLSEFHEENPKKDQVAVGWTETFRSTHMDDKSVRLLRDIRESR